MPSANSRRAPRAATTATRVVHVAAYAAISGLLLSLYWLAAQVHASAVNRWLSNADQGAYLAEARTLAESNYQEPTGRNRMPLYLYLTSLAYRPGLSERAYFDQAKQWNIETSLVVLGGVGALLAWCLPWLDAAVLLTLAAFTVFVFRAPHVQAEVLYYGFHFATFVTLLRTLRHARARDALASGTLAALAHGTKASATPMLLVFFAWSLAGAVTRFARARAGRDDIRGATRPLVAAGMVGLGFAICLAPYFYRSHAIHGEWLYNVNTTRYAWMDSWDDVLRATARHGSHLQSPPLVAPPSARQYFSSHSAAQIRQRVTEGLRAYAAAVREGLYAPFLQLFAATSVLLVVRWPRTAVEILTGNGRWVCSGFAITSIVAYGLLLAFYHPIAGGPRFLLAHFLPTFFCLIGFAGRREWRHAPLVSVGRFRIAPWHVHWVAVVLLLDYLTTTFAGKIFLPAYQ